MEKAPDFGGRKTKPIQACPERSRMEPISEARRDREQGKGHKSQGISMFGGCESV